MQDPGLLTGLDPSWSCLFHQQDKATKCDTMNQPFANKVGPSTSLNQFKDQLIQGPDIIAVLTVSHLFLSPCARQGARNLHSHLPEKMSKQVPGPAWLIMCMDLFRPSSEDVI